MIALTQKEAKAMVEEHGSIRGAARAFGKAESTFRGWLNGTGKRGSAAKVVPVKPGAKKKTLADFRSTYDKSYVVPKKIKAALSDMGASWEYEVDFAKQAGVSLSDIGMFRDQFNEHIVQVKEGRRMWAGTKSMANQMREMV
jgi:hypothetical protein